MKMYYIVSRIEASQDDSPYVYIFPTLMKRKGFLLILPL